MSDRFEAGISPERLEAKKEVAETENYPVLNTALQQRYDRIAPNWEGEAYSGTRRDDLIPILMREAFLEDGHTVLEAMSGTGRLSKEILKRFPAITSYVLDFSRGMLNAAPDQSHKVQASVIATPFEDRSFDRVFMRSGIYDLPKRLQLKALQEINRILKPDGKFILQTYCSSPETNKALNDIVNIKDLASGHYQDMGSEYPRYFSTQDELYAWLQEAGFEIEPLQEFDGIIKYLETREMTDLGKSVWVDYMEKLPPDIKEKLHVTKELNGSITYRFPGVIWRLVKKAA